MTPAGTHLFGSSDDSEYSVDQAREYISGMGYVTGQVKLVKRDGQVMVIAKIDIL